MSELPPPEQRCRATSKRTEDQCGAWKVPGAEVCRWHGANTPQAKRRSTERVAEVEARKAFGKLVDHAEPVTDPFAAFAEIAGHAVAWEKFCAGKIEELQELRFEDAKGAEQIRGDIVLFERAMDRCASFLASYAKLGIEERMARIDEAERDTIIRAVEAVLTHLGITPQQRPAVEAILAKELAA